MRWKWKVCGGLLMVGLVVALTCGAAASFDHVSRTAMPSDVSMASFLSIDSMDAIERFDWARALSETQKCFITNVSPEDPLEKTQEAVFDRRKIPALAAFYLSKTFSFRRFLREKSVETVAVNQKISIITSALSNVVLKLEVNSPLIQLFSIQIAVRK